MELDKLMDAEDGARSVCKRIGIRDWKLGKGWEPLPPLLR